MTSWIGKVENQLHQNEQFDNNIVLTHDLQDCLDESLDFNFNKVYSDSDNISLDNKTDTKEQNG